MTAHRKRDDATTPQSKGYLTSKEAWHTGRSRVAQKKRVKESQCEREGVSKRAPKRVKETYTVCLLVYKTKKEGKVRL